jgi:hypothetical protein
MARCERGRRADVNNPGAGILDHGLHLKGVDAVKVSHGQSPVRASMRHSAAVGLQIIRQHFQRDELFP